MVDGLPNEIVIVRRKNGWDEDNHPHGVWKIAYADFMTALMAFFLVMWLINVTDESVRKGVAQYFNPVKLASTAPNRKGLNDPEVDGESNEDGTKLFKGQLGGSDAPAQEEQDFGDGLKASGSTSGQADTAADGSRPMPGQFTQIHSESILFSDPYAVLDTLSESIRVSKSLEDNPQGIGSGVQKEPGNQGGQAYRDPFDPMFWQFRPGRGVESAESALAPAGDGDADGFGPSDVQLGGTFAWGAPFEEGNSRKPGQPDETVAADAETTGPNDPGRLEGGRPLEASGELEQAINSEGEASEALPPRMDPVLAHVLGRTANSEILAAATPPSEGFEVIQSEMGETEFPVSEGMDETVEASGAEALVARVSEVLESTRGTVLEETAAQITVARDGEGALISLTDDQNFGMFAIGSAEPRPELVKLLERIGKIVSETPGQIVIKGHTDARPFRSKTYDNWRLSSARAHMALYMLSRGGVSKDRFERVEGYADRHLKTPADPYAANNRRIEIYLLEGNG